MGAPSVPAPQGQNAGQQHVPARSAHGVHILSSQGTELRPARRRRALSKILAGLLHRDLIDLSSGQALSPFSQRFQAKTHAEKHFGTGMTSWFWLEG